MYGLGSSCFGNFLKAWRGMAAMDEKVRYWLDIAEYDLATAEAMLKAERYLLSASCVIRRWKRY